MYAIAEKIRYENIGSSYFNGIKKNLNQYYKIKAKQKNNYKNKDIYTLLDSGINRWEPLFFNPQKNCIEPFDRNGANTNLLSLDKHISECGNR